MNLVFLIVLTFVRSPTEYISVLVRLSLEIWKLLFTKLLANDYWDYLPTSKYIFIPSLYLFTYGIDVEIFMNNEIIRNVQGYIDGILSVLVVVVVLQS